MGQAIEHIRAHLDNEPLHTMLIVRRDVLREAVAEADTVRELLRCAEGRASEPAQRAAALEAELARKSFEIQILQMTQGALKMEIDHLRAASAPTIAATGAEVMILTDGTVRIKADCLSVSSAAVPA
jgi:hypothetical protein